MIAPVRKNTEAVIRKKLRDNFPHYASKCLFIRSKDSTIIPLELRQTQLFLHQACEDQKARTGMVRKIVLKGRQQYISTYTQARFYHRVTHGFGLRCYILTHEQDATDKLFEMAQRFYALCPELVRPELGPSNAKELIFSGLDSGYAVGTAGSKGTGRSGTFQLFHGSEMAHWRNAGEHLAGVGQAVPMTVGSEVILESTANGPDNEFHTLWQLAVSGKGHYEPVFLPWMWIDEYRDTPIELSPDDIEYMDAYGCTLEQMAWRRAKIDFDFLGDAGMFDQEYPAVPELAFKRSRGDPFIRHELVAKARSSQYDESGALVLGIDPCEMGDDDLAIAVRRGRVCREVMAFAGKMETMEVTGICGYWIDKLNPDGVFVDATGVGAGVYSRLKELFPRLPIYRVMGGGAAIQDKVYADKRTETWATMSEWLDDGAQLPDDQQLASELTTLSWKFDSSYRKRLESKSSPLAGRAMRAVGIKSPNKADALALTFANPCRPRNHNHELKPWQRPQKPKLRNWITA